MSDLNEIVSGLILELRRGTIILCVLSQLSEPEYGYSLVRSLEKKGVSIDPGTLYPLLRRLEKQEILKSQWDTNEARPRKYYLLSETGKEVYIRLCEEWRTMVSSIERLIMSEGEC